MGAQCDLLLDRHGRAPAVLTSERFMDGGRMKLRSDPNSESHLNLAHRQRGAAAIECAIRRAEAHRDREGENRLIGQEPRVVPMPTKPCFAIDLSPHIDRLCSEASPKLVDTQGCLEM